jgi:hypothetical protein
MQLHPKALYTQSQNDAVSVALTNKCPIYCVVCACLHVQGRARSELSTHHLAWKHRITMLHVSFTGLYVWHKESVFVHCDES